MAELIVSNVLNLNEILQPQVVFIPRVLSGSKVWRRMVQVQVTPALPFIRDLACHIVIQPIGWWWEGVETKLEISPREDNVQNNVAVKMKFDQRFNVTSERQDNARSSVVRAGVQRGGEGASLIFAPVEWGASWLAPWQERQRHS